MGRVAYEGFTITLPPGWGEVLEDATFADTAELPPVTFGAEEGVGTFSVLLQGAGDKVQQDWDWKSSVNGGRDQKAEMFPIDTSVADAPGVRVTVESETDFEQFPGKEKH